jgi:hypothetical protein
MTKKAYQLEDLTKSLNAQPVVTTAAQLAVVEPTPATQSTPSADQIFAGAHKTLSVRTDPARYKKLRRACLDYDKTGQDIFIEALDDWFKKHNL